MFNTTVKYICSLAAVAVLAACGEDNERFEATFPVFKGFEAKTLVNNANDNRLKVGVPFVISAVESQQGRHLYQANYHWTVSPADEVVQSYKSTVVYDDKAGNATDTITVKSAGSYKVTLVATYDVAGIGKGSVPQVGRLPNNGGDISYKSSALKYVVTLTKVFRVVD